MNLTAKKISGLIGGKIIGNSDEKINNIAKIEEGKKGDLCFLSNPKYTHYIYSSNASVIIVNNNFLPKEKIKCTLIKVKDPYLSFTKLLSIYKKISFTEVGISKKADINQNTKIGEDVFVGSFSTINSNVTLKKNVKILSNCCIGNNVTIGENTIIFPGVTIYNNCIIGANNIIHAGAVIGSDGFGFASENENYFKINQTGNVITEENVEIGANTTIDRATLGSTRIGEGVKLDNLIQIGHNVQIQKHTVIAAHVAIAGSTKIGEKCMIGGNSSIAGHLNIGNNVKIAGHSGVGSNIQNNQTVQGPFAFNLKDFQRAYVIFKKLPEIYKRMRKTTQK